MGGYAKERDVMGQQAGDVPEALCVQRAVEWADGIVSMGGTHYSRKGLLNSRCLWEPKLRGWEGRMERLQLWPVERGGCVITFLFYRTSSENN